MAFQQWQTLGRGPFGLSATDPGCDPMWLWAEATGYADFSSELRRHPNAARWLVCEFSAHAQPASDRFRSMALNPSAWKRQRRQFRRVELTEPVWSGRPIARSHAAATRDVAQPVLSTSDVLVGIIDSGCPFAAEMLRDTSGRGTRVWCLWDQDARPSFAAVVGGRPPGLNYGRAVYRDHLNALMRKASTPDGRVDEDLCYRLADYEVMRYCLSHGASVMSQLFAPIASPDGRDEHALAPGGSGAVDTSALDAADIVFVQVPRAGVQDASSAALSRYLIDGLRFIVSHATPGVTKRIVINISSGTSRNGHDGASLIETAMSAWVDEVKTWGIDLWIVLPIGNTNDEQRHGVLSDENYALELFVPPGCESPQFVTVRWPKGSSGVGLRVTPPSAAAGTVREGEAKAWPSARAPQCAVISPPAIPGETRLSLIAISPTASTDPGRPIAPAGRWKLQLDFDVKSKVRPEDPVHFWISRNQRNLGALTRGRQADFVDFDERHQPQRYLSRLYDAEGHPPENGISRRSALSGLASAAHKDHRLVVVGGCIARDRVASSYSASGPSAGPMPGRRGPDVSAIADASWALPGVTTRGNRSGETARVIGTSFAAPSVARELAISGQVPQDLDTKRSRVGPRLVPSS